MNIYNIMELNNSLSTIPRLLYLLYLITCQYPDITSKAGDILHSLGHLLLTLGADITSHGLLFKAAILVAWVLLRWSNSQALLLSYQLISVALHGSSFHPATVYIYDLVEHILLIPKRNIPLEIII